MTVGLQFGILRPSGVVLRPGSKKSSLEKSVGENPGNTKRFAGRCPGTWELLMIQTDNHHILGSLINDLICAWRWGKSLSFGSDSHNLAPNNLQESGHFP